MKIDSEETQKIRKMGQDRQHIFNRKKARQSLFLFFFLHLWTAFSDATVDKAH